MNLIKKSIKLITLEKRAKKPSELMDKGSLTHKMTYK